MPAITKTCGVCKKKFKARLRKERGSHSKYCSMPCYRKAPKSEEMREKLRQDNLKNPRKYWLGKERPEMLAENNPKWRGDDVSYAALHQWLYKRLGKANNCSYRDCQGKSKNYHWANLSHSVSRDVSDYTALCVSCHKLYDLRKIAL